MPYILGFVIEGKNVVGISEDNSLCGSDDAGEALKMLPNYKENHRRGHEASMSAVIHWMQFSPRLFFFDCLEDIGEAMLDQKILTGGSIAGRIKFSYLKPDYIPNIAHEAKLIESE